MRAKDDAPTAPPSSPRRHPIRVSWLGLLLGTLLGAASVGSLAERFAPDGRARYESRVSWSGPALQTSDWPRPARPGESAEIVREGGAPTLVVRSFTWRGAETLAGEIQRRHASALSQERTLRERARARWAQAPAPGPADSLGPAAECAALARGRALVARALGQGLSPTTAEAPPGGSEYAALRVVEARVDRLALSGRVDSLHEALDAASIAEGAWLEGSARSLGTGGEEDLRSRWRAHQRLRAAELDSVASTLESWLPPESRARVALAAPGRALALEPRCVDPTLALLTAVPVEPTNATPIPRVWATLLGFGAALGLLITAPLAIRRAPRRRRGANDALLPRGLDPRQAGRGAWLQVLSGPDAAHIADAATWLSSHFLALGERVLLVDAGRRLRLHVGFAGDSRWGLVECLAGEMPVLGSVQSAGRPGVYLLARGQDTRDERWSQLGRVLDEARPHFGRIVLALDFAAPHAVGEALQGRAREGWWAQPGPLGRTARALGERVGISLSAIDLDALAEYPPELVENFAPVVAEREEVAAPEPEVEFPEPTPVPPAEPIVVDCDLQVRERLRFLIWMRQVQAERRREPVEPLART